jgi:ABC-2 type transport system permease protein
MSTTSPAPASVSEHHSPSRPADDSRPSAVRLTAVELRKMVNTRSGFWVVLAIAGLVVMAALVNGLADGGRNATYVHVFHVTAVPATYLLPLLSVLLVCSEWTQRTTLTTFALAPVRFRVIIAKATASLVVATAGLLLTLVVSVAFTAAFGHASHGAGTLSLSVIAQGWVGFATWMLIGLAFGTALLATAPAIVAYLILPNAWNALGSAVPSLAGKATWLSASKSTTPLTMHVLSGTEWVHVAGTLVVWVGVPLLVGLRRVRRGDIG